MPLSSCDDDRLTLAQQARSSLADARLSAKNGDYARALECYLFAFDNSLAVNGWGGVRLSYIPSEIAELGMKYPPATEALRLRRDEREKLIRAGETNYEVIAEWASINRYLNEQDRELGLLKELQETGSLSDSLKQKIVNENFDRLMERRDYSLLGEYFNRFGKRFMYRIFHYERARIFPEQNERSGTEREHRRSDIAKAGADVFELALGTNRLEQADGIVDRVLLHCNTAEAFKLLIAAAERAGKKRKAKELSKRAKSSLDSAEYFKFEHPEKNEGQTFLALIEKAFESRNTDRAKFEPALEFLRQQKGVDGCLIASSDGKVACNKFESGVDANALSSAAVSMFRDSALTVDKLRQGNLGALIFGTTLGQIVVFNLHPVFLVICAESGMEELFSDTH